MALSLLVATALLCATIGVGGGFLIVAILLYRMRLPMQVATGTALALTICTAAPGLIGKILTGQVSNWAPVPVILVAMILGAIAGARVTTSLSGRALRLGLAGIPVPTPSDGHHEPRTWLCWAGRTRQR